MIIHDFAGEDPWVQHMKDGKVQISFVKLNSPTLIAWLLQNGSRFKVVKPESIKNQVIEELNKALENYNK